VAVGGKRADKTFGKSAKPDYTWEDGGWFDLQIGPVLLCLDDPRPFARFQKVPTRTGTRARRRRRFISVSI
jgi:hypothetical protein